MDHHAIILQVGDPDTAISNPTTNQLNWKHADEESFMNTLKELLEENKLEYNHMVSELLNYKKQTAMPEDLARATDFIQQLLEDTVKKAVPECRICSRSKPWWTPELLKAYKDLCEACSLTQGWMREFHMPSIILAE